MLKVRSKGNSFKSDSGLTIKLSSKYYMNGLHTTDQSPLYEGNGFKVASHSLCQELYGYRDFQRKK